MRTLNRNEKRRLELIGEFIPRLQTEAYDIQHFENLDADTLLTLISEGFVDIEEAQNDSPTIRQFLAFMYERKQLVTCHGYIVSPNREDYRVSVEGLTQLWPASLADKLAFTQFCRGADELETKDGETLRSWWD